MCGNSESVGEFGGNRLRSRTVTNRFAQSHARKQLIHFELTIQRKLILFLELLGCCGGKRGYLRLFIGIRVGVVVFDRGERVAGILHIAKRPPTQLPYTSN